VLPPDTSCQGHCISQACSYFNNCSTAQGDCPENRNCCAGDCAHLAPSRDCYQVGGICKTEDCPDCVIPNASCPQQGQFCCMDGCDSVDIDSITIELPATCSKLVEGSEEWQKCKENPIGFMFIKVLNWVTLFGLVVVGLVLVFAGFMYVTSAGDIERAKKAKKIMLWAIVGLVVLAGSKIIVSIVKYLSGTSS